MLFIPMHPHVPACLPYPCAAPPACMQPVIIAGAAYYGLIPQLFKLVGMGAEAGIIEAVRGAVALCDLCSSECSYWRENALPAKCLCRYEHGCV